MLAIPKSKLPFGLRVREALFSFWVHYSAFRPHWVQRWEIIQKLSDEIEKDKECISRDLKEMATIIAASTENIEKAQQLCVQTRLLSIHTHSLVVRTRIFETETSLFPLEEKWLFGSIEEGISLLKKSVYIAEGTRFKKNISFRYDSLKKDTGEWCKILKAKNTSFLKVEPTKIVA